MKPEIKQLIIKELSDLKGRKVFKVTDARILDSDKRMTPIDTVKTWYEKYQELGSLEKTAKFFNTQTSAVLSKFKEYQFPFKTLIVLKKEKKDQIAQEKYDAQILDPETWMSKYNKTKTVYYNRRRGKKDDMELLQKMQDTLELSYSNWMKKYNSKSPKTYYNIKEKYLKILEHQNVNNL